MNNYFRCAAKDYLRDADTVLCDLEYACIYTKPKNSITTDFISDSKNICKAVSLLSEGLISFSSSPETTDLAEGILSKCALFSRELSEAKRFCKGCRVCREKYSEYLQSSGRIKERMISDLRCAEVSERINLDYLIRMLCLSEGLFRLCDAAASAELCRAAQRPARELRGCSSEWVSTIRALLPKYQNS